MTGSLSAMPSPMRRRTSRRSSSGVAGLLCPLLGACLWATVVGYKPVIIVHGLFDSSGDFINLKRFINEVSGHSKEAFAQFGCFLSVIGHKHCVARLLTLYTDLQALQLV